MRSKIAPRRIDPNDAGKKKRRFHPGTVALRDIKKQIKSSLKGEYALPKLSFYRVVRECAQNVPWGLDKRFSESAVRALQTAIEQEEVEMFTRAVRNAVHSKRQTVMRRDLRLFAYNSGRLGQYYKEIPDNLDEWLRVTDKQDPNDLVTSKAKEKKASKKKTSVRNSAQATTKVVPKQEQPQEKLVDVDDNVSDSD